MYCETLHPQLLLLLLLLGTESRTAVLQLNNPRGSDIGLRPVPTVPLGVQLLQAVSRLDTDRGPSRARGGYHKQRPEF